VFFRVVAFMGVSFVEWISTGKDQPLAGSFALRTDLLADLVEAWCFRLGWHRGTV
jgi:hypothetical protein